MIKKKSLLLPAIAVVACATACMQEKEIPGGELYPGDEYAVKFVVGGSDVTTKSGKSASKPVVTDIIAVSKEDGQEFFLEESVTPMDAVLYNTSSVTKGAPVYTETFGTLFKNFGAVAYEYETATTSTTAKPVTDLTLLDSSNKVCFLASGADASPLEYRYSFDEGYWPKDAEDNMLFFMSAPDMVSSLSAGVTSINYLYKAGVSGKNNGVIEFAYTSPSTAAEQKDILFTSKAIERESYNKDTGNAVLFYHTLAGVKFKAGNAGDYVTNITSVKIEGIYNSGTCTVTPNYEDWGYPGTTGVSNVGGAANTKSSAVSIWSNRSGSATFERTGNPIEINSVSDGQFPDSFKGTSGTLGDNNLMDANFENTFFFIPQTTPAGTKITIKYTITTDKNETKSYTKSLAFENKTWKAGEIYTYTLTGKDLDIYIVDELDSSKATKSNVTITNTGNMTSYIRVAVVANWFDSHETGTGSYVSDGTPGHIIVNQTWDVNTEILSRLSINENWIMGGDGFFYYKHPVAGGATISAPIFSTYTAPSGDDAPTGAHLEMDLAVQSVDASAVWPWVAKPSSIDSEVDYGNLPVATE